MTYHINYLLKNQMTKSNKKICMTVLNDFTHDSRVLREAKALQQAGYQVFVFALFEPGLKEKETVENIQAVRIPLKTRKILEKTNIRFIRFIEFMIRVLAHIKKINPLVCHCHDFNTLPIGYLAKKLFKTKLIYDSHELESHKAPGEKKDPHWFLWLHRRAEHFFMRKADAIITVGDCIADYLVKQDHIKRPIVVRNIEEEAKEIDYEVMRKKHFNLSQDYKIVIYQGGLQKWRGIESLIQALKYLDKKIILALVGDGPLKKNFETMVEKLSLSDRVIFTGWVKPEELLSYTLQADLGTVSSENLCLSYYYTLPSKFFQYIRAGIPLGISDFPDMKKIVNKYDIGVCFNPSDPKDVAKAIKKGFKEGYYKKLKENVIKIQELFTWDKEKQKLIELYNQLNK